jgi:CBS domain-containing protein
VEPAEFTTRGQHLDPVEHHEQREPTGTVTEGARRGAEPAGGEDGLRAPVGSIVSRPALFVSPDATVGEAARAMREAGTGSVLVEAPSPGIVTDRDLRNRVLADERTAETPVRAIMSHPLKSLPAETPLHEVLLLMLDEDVHHVPVTREGRIVGVVTDKDLLRRQARGPLPLLERIKSVRRLDALEGYVLEVAATARSLLGNDVEPVRIARVIASLSDALTTKLLCLAENELGSPPCPYAWLALGSEGRMEQVLITDQDNALVYRDDTPEAHEYFRALADRAVDGLLRSGFPPCPGGYMATRWRRPLAAWEVAFARWLETPEPQALLEAEIFLDFRRVHGDLSIEPLERILLSGAGHPVFLFQLARAATRFRPPLRPIGRIRAEHGEVDLKRGGLAAIVLLARLGALTAGSLARGTLERLDAAAGAGALGPDTVEAVGDAFRFLLRLRLREQLRSLDAGRDPGNSVRVESLSPLERRRLREAFKAVADAQRSVALRYRTYVGE